MSSDGRVYIGNLPHNVRERDVEDLFYKYGAISFIDIKGGQQGPPFAFIKYDDPRDASDAVKYRDGYDYDGYRLRVEFPRGNGPHTSRGGGGGAGGYDRGGYSRGGFSAARGRGGPPTRRSDYRVLVSGLPPTGSWQDIKDHMREAGDVCYADVYKDGTGVVEFLKYDDMKYAAKKLDDSKFRSHEGESAYIRVKEDYRDGGGRSRSRSPAPRAAAGGRGGSPSYSPMRHRSRSPYN